MNQSIEQTGIPQAQIEGFVNAFFEQLEPRPKKARPWTFDRLNAACDTPGAEPVQAILYRPLSSPFCTEGETASYGAEPGITGGAPGPDGELVRSMSWRGRPVRLMLLPARPDWTKRFTN